MRDEHQAQRDQERGKFLASVAARQMTLKDRIAAAKKHASENGQMNDALWRHQAFSLTLGELLNAAERAV